MQGQFNIRKEWGNNMHDVLMAVITSLVPVIVAWIGYVISRSVKTEDSFKALSVLVDAAVNFAEKSGAINQLTGSEQFQVAFKFVQDQLAKLHITQQDEELIKALIEQSWSQQREHLEAVYKSGKQEASQQALAKQKADLDKQAEQLESLKADIDNKVTALKSLTDNVSTVLDSDKKASADDSNNTSSSSPVVEGESNGAKQ